MENLEFGEKKWNLNPGVLPYKKYGGAHQTFRDGQLEKWWGVGGSGWDLFQLAYRNSISRSLPLEDFSRVQVPCSSFLGGGGWGITGGGGGGKNSTAAILTMTLATIWLHGNDFKQIFVFCFIQSFCFTQCQNYILQGKHNEASDTFLKVLFPNWWRCIAFFIWCLGIEV